MCQSWAVTFHDHLCLDPTPEPCASCMDIATIREDERWRLIELIQQLPDGRDSKAGILEAIEPPGDWRGMARMPDFNGR